VSTTELVVITPAELPSWPAALEAAVRDEFHVSPFVPPPGSPLVPAECAVDGCPRAGFRAPWGRFGARLCHAHAHHWLDDGRPAESQQWLATQRPMKIMRATVGCGVQGCPRAAPKSGVCRAHHQRWVLAGRPPLEEFILTAPPVQVAAGICPAPDCNFPVSGWAGLCDRHLALFYAWRHHRRTVDERDPTVQDYVDSVRARTDGSWGLRLVMPDTSLLDLECRLVLQHRHDKGQGLIQPRRWTDMVAQLNALGVGSILDHDLEWWRRQHDTPGRPPRWINYVNYAWRTLFAFRAHSGLDDPWAHDLWHTEALPIETRGRRRNLDWRRIRPSWLRELCKRWARHKLRHGVSVVHVDGVRLAIIRLCEFCETRDWSLREPDALTREMFDAFLDYVRRLDYGWVYKGQIAFGVKQVFEDSQDLGWVRLRVSRVFLPGELPSRRGGLPRALPAEVVKRLNDPEALAVLSVAERALVLVLMDGGLRATDTARLRADVVTVGSDGAPYLRYWNHKRRREAILPISDRATEAIAAQQAWVHEHFPGCEWLFPRLHANGRGGEPMGYAFVYQTLRRWARTLDLRDQHGEPLTLQPHAFRHTYATTLVNKDVDLFSVQALLDHDSPEMTWRYARMSQETLRRKWEQAQQRINIRGEIVPLDIDGELSDAAWAKEKISRAKQSLPNGWCGLPLQQTCPHPNACLTCPAFLTDQTFLSLHREQLSRTDQLIEHARSNGNERVIEINEATKASLLAIIERGEQLERDNPTPEVQADTDAAA
jgi:integrase